MNRLRTFALLAVAAAAACDHRPEDFTPLRGEVQQLSDRTTRELSRLLARHARLAERLGALPGDAPGVADLAAGLSGTRVRLDEARAKLAGVRDDALAKVDGRRRKPAQDALARGASDLRTLLEQASVALDGHDQALAEAERAAAAARAAAPPPVPAAVKQAFEDPAFARTAGTASVTGLAWKGDGAVLDLAPPASKAVADALVAFAGTCAELRFTITAHTARDGVAAAAKRLSVKRAAAVKDYLVAKGIPAARITRTDGVGGTRPLVDEPEPGSPAEQAMAPADLAAIREQNRRLTLAVATPCAAP